MRQTPPKYAEKLLLLFLKDELAEEVLGDLDEKFLFQLKKKSLRAAKLNYWYQVLNYLRPFALKPINSKSQIKGSMIKHNFLISYRGFLKHRLTFFINLIGLSSAIASGILIYIWIKGEREIDQFHMYGDRIQAVYQNIKTADFAFNTDATPPLLAAALEAEVHEVSLGTAVLQDWFRKKQGVISEGNSAAKYRASEYYSDQNFFKVFSFDLAHGDPENPYPSNSSVLLSDELAAKLFDDENPLGRRITWEQTGAEGDYIVSGIFRKPGRNSSLQFDLLFPLAARSERDSLFSNWYNSNVQTYVVLNGNADRTSFSENLSGVMNRKQQGSDIVLHSQPFNQMYLNDKLSSSQESIAGKLLQIRLFTLIACFVLVIAAINFMNLTTARASRRLKEIGVKKAIGASRLALIAQYFVESILLSIVSLCVAAVLAWILLPLFSHVIGKTLSFPLDGNSFRVFLAIGLVMGILAGSYPAFYLSGFKPIEVLKGKLDGTFGDQWIRKGLVVFQFAVSVLLILGVVIISGQISFMQNKELGFNRNNVIQFDFEAKTKQEFSGFLASLRALPGIKDAAGFNQNLLKEYGMTTGVAWEGIAENQSTQFATIEGGFDFLKTMEVELLAGRNYRAEDQSNKIILNEAAVKQIGWESAVGRRITLWGQEREIIGVAKDFYFARLHESIKPCLVLLNPKLNKVIARIDGLDQAATISAIERLFQSHRPGLNLQYTFLDYDFEEVYASEQKLAFISRQFAVISVVISCLGLLGLTMFSFERRAKEISIRRVLGASEIGTLLLLAREFTVLIVASLLVALPFGYYLSVGWLQNFANAMDLNPIHFGLTALIALSIAWLTIGIQAWQSIQINPATRLRNE